MSSSREPSPAISGVREPAFRAVNGQIYRLSEASGWWPMDDAFAGRLWATYAATASDPSDWFRVRAGQLAAELLRAIDRANAQRTQEKAA